MKQMKLNSIECNASEQIIMRINNLYSRINLQLLTQVIYAPFRYD